MNLETLCQLVNHLQAEIAELRQAVLTKDALLATAVDYCASEHQQRLAAEEAADHYMRLFDKEVVLGRSRPNNYYFESQDELATIIPVTEALLMPAKRDVNYADLDVDDLIFLG